MKRKRRGYMTGSDFLCAMACLLAVGALFGAVMVKGCTYASEHFSIKVEHK